MKKSTIALIGIGIIAVVIVLGYFAFFKPKIIAPVQPTPTPTLEPTSTLTPVPSTTPTPTPTPDEVSDVDTSDWETYENEKYGFEIKYPKEWIIETYDGKYTEIKKDQINADWIQFALYTKDEQKIKNYGENMIANVDVSVDTKYIAIEDYLKDFGYDFNENTLKEGRILLTRGIAKVWMKIREEEFKGQKAYVIEYSDSGYYLYFKNQNIYKISSLWNTNEINKNNILDIVNTIKFIN